MKKLLLFITFWVYAVFLNAQINIAPQAVASASTCNTGPCSTLNDLNFGTCGSQQMWIPTSTPPTSTPGVDWIMFEWTSPQTFDKFIIHHAQNNARLLTGGLIQRWDGNNWVNHHTFSNLPPACSNQVSFPKVTTTRVRITSFQMTGPGQQSNPNFREWEIISAPTLPNDAGIAGLDSPQAFCPGIHNVRVRVANFGTNKIDTVTVNWSVNNVPQTPFLLTQPLDTVGGTGPNQRQVLLGSWNFVANTSYNFKFWTSNPNGVPDPFNENDTLSMVLTPAISGTFTINSTLPTSGTNFQSFTAFSNFINAAGVCGPVVVNVAPGSGPYTEQVTFGNIQGASSVNSITINGNGNTLRFSPTTNARHILKLNGTRHMTIDSLTIASQSTDFGWAVWLENNADSNTVKRCTLDLSSVTSITLANSGGVVMSASPTSNTTAGTTGSGNLFEGNTILGNAGGGPAYGFSLYGATTGASGGNIIRNNIILNTYADGIRVSNMPNTLIEGNLIARPNKTATTTFYGIWALGTAGVNENLIIRNNRIWNVNGALPATNTSQFGGIYITAAGSATGPRALVANNIIDLSGTNGTYNALWITQPRINVLHNTIYISAPTSTTGLTRGLYSTATAANSIEVWMRNNLVFINRGGTSTKHCISISNPYSSNSIIDNNAYFIVNPPANSGVGQLGTANFATLANWQTAANGAYDQLSVFGDPAFVNPTANNYQPTAVFLNGVGANVTNLVPTDINGLPRPPAPVPGAIQFSPPPGPNPGILSFLQPSGVTCGTSATAQIRIVNFGIDTVTSMTIQWKVNNVVIDTIPWTGILASNGFVDITLGTFTVAPNVLYSIEARILTSGPGVDVDASNNILTLNNVRSGLQGTYTINPALPASATNFQTFNQLKDALSTIGVCSAVVVNVEPFSGPYIEQVEFGATPGASATNTITINGNGNTIQFAPNTNDRYVIRLNGTKHLRLDSLTITTTSADFGWAVWLDNNADSNIIRKCTLNISSVTSITIANSAGIVMSGSATSSTTAGNTGSGNLFENNVILGNPGGGPGYGIVLYGATNGAVGGNTIRNNTILNSYSDAIRVSNMPNTTIEGNFIARPTKTATTTFYGIWALGTAGVNENLVIRNNRILNVAGAIPATNTSQFGGIYVSSAGSANTPRALIANNIIEMSGTNGTYNGLWITQPRINVLHNTIYLESPTSTTALTRGLYSTATAANSIETAIRNNVVFVNRGGSSAKHCISISNPYTTNSVINNNAYFILNPPGNGGVGQIGSTNFASITDWQQANNGAYDQNSVFANPAFINPANDNFTPQSGALNNIGANVLSLVPTDINGVARTATPDPGAIEFSPLPCSGAWAFKADSIFPQGVILSWQSMVDTFEIDWGPVGFTPGSPPGNTITGIAAKTFNLALPAVNTCYHVYVREVCGSSFGPYTGPLLVCTPIQFDAELEEIVGITNRFCGDSSTVIRFAVRNNGFGPITSLPYQFAISGDINQTFSGTYTTPIPPGGRDTITVGTLNTYQGGLVNITASVNLANDQDNGNDSINKGVTIIPFAPRALPTQACAGSTTATLVGFPLPGVGYRWFDAPTGGTLLGTGDSLTIGNINVPHYLEYQSVNDSLFVSNAGGTGCTHGNMFDLMSPTGVSITGFTLVPLSTATNHQVTIWIKTGSWQGSTQADWTQVFTTTIPSVTIDVPFFVSLPTPISLTPNQVTGFYVQHNARYSTGSLTVSNADLTFISGNGHCSAFDYCCNPRVFNGRIHYGKQACSNIRTQVNVDVIDTPTAAFTYTISNYTVSFAGTFTDADSVYWTFGTAGNSSQQNPTFTFPQNGVYPVCVTAFNSCGTATKCDTLTFSIGINEIALQNRLKVYPNPNAGVFEVTFSDDVAELPIEVLDLTGKAVYRATWKSAAGHYHERLDLHTLPAGTYMLRIHSTVGQLTRKVVVQK